MAKIEEALHRNYNRKYVCRKCKSVIRADALKVIAGKIACRRCGFSKLRAPRKR
jgi:ribosomal protein L40E